MYAKIYIWESDLKTMAAGHASMSLSNGIHISWWPSSPVMKWGVVNNESRPANPNQTLRNDIDFEQAQPITYVLDLTPAQVETITKWWRDFKKQHTDWNLKNLNCSTVVYQALRAAFPTLGAEAALRGAFPGLEAEAARVWTPSRIEQLVKRMGAREEQKQPQPGHNPKFQRDEL